MPCVSEETTKPPLRPLAPNATRLGLEQHDVAAGSSVFAASAAHRPVNPPPTMHRSVSVGPLSAGCGSRAGIASSQKGRGRASA